MAYVRETSLVECTFTGSSDMADIRVRYFLANREIRFAGHPMIANDLIMTTPGHFMNAEAWADLHWKDREAILSGLGKVHDGPTVVMTHHIPVRQMIVSVKRPQRYTPSRDGSEAVRLTLVVTR